MYENLLNKSSYKINISLENIILFLLSYTLLIDTINGVLLRAGMISVSFFYKSLIVGLIIYYLRYKLYTIFILSILAFYFFIHYLTSANITASLAGLTDLIKFISIVFYYYFFVNVSRKKGEKVLGRVVKITYFIIALNLVLGTLGFGYQQYTGGIGTRGFIYAGNELTGALVLSGAIIQINLIENRKHKKFFLFSVFHVLLSLLLATKVAMLSSLLLFLILPFIKLLNRKSFFRFNKKDFGFVILLSVVFPIIVIVGLYYVLYELNLIVRLEYFYKNNGLITLIFSRRNIWAEEALKTYVDYNIMELVFGNPLWIDIVSFHKKVEIDFMDFLMMYGIFGIIIAYGFLIYTLINIIVKGRKNSRYLRYMILMIFFIIMLSLTSGHILNSGIAGPVIGVLLAMTTIK